MTEAGGAGRLRIGTRGSALALRQTEWVAERVRRIRPDLVVEIVRIQTSGDRIQGRALAEIGGKGLFIKEIEEALIDGRVDLGVHSMKDLPAAIAPGLAIVAVPEREDPRDVLVASGGGPLAALPRGARVGTGSLRRRALLHAARPDLEVVPLRGNVDTRLRKWREGQVDALVLAAAGLRRLGLEVDDARFLDVDEWLPAIGQGALALEAAPESPWWTLLAALDHPESATATRAERAFLAALGGDCTTPLAAHARIAGDDLRLVAAVTDPDGRRWVRGEERGAPAEAEAVGLRLGRRLLTAGGAEILRELRR